jgi:hypothetical protein
MPPPGGSTMGVVGETEQATEVTVDVIEGQGLEGETASENWSPGPPSPVPPSQSSQPADSSRVVSSQIQLTS